MEVICPECGGGYETADDNCFVRFDRLLALDHARKEPWGSRHGLAFGAFALQHPLTPVFRSSLDTAWLALCSIYLLGKPQSYVFRTLRSAHVQPSKAIGIPARPSAPLAKPHFTIRDLEDFESATYAQRLDDWCRAALQAWGAELPAPVRTARGDARGQALVIRS